MKPQPKPALTSDPTDRGVEKPSLGIWVRYRVSSSGAGYTREPKPRFLFPQPEGPPPEGWAAPGSPEDDRLRAEIEAKLGGLQPVVPAARPLRRPPPRPTPRA
jgi:hypothetical protein